MYQVFFKDDYKTNAMMFEKLFKSFRGLFYHNKLKELFFKKQYILYTVKCNVDGKLEFYYDFSVKEKRSYLLEHLKVAFSEDFADIIEIDDREDSSKLYYNNSIHKYREEKMYKIVDFENENIKYILSTLTPGMRLRLKIYIDHNDKYYASLKVSGSKGVNFESIKTACNIIQQTTAKNKNKNGKMIKLHVVYDSKEDIYSKYTMDELLNFVFIPYNLNKIPTVDVYSTYIKEDELGSGVSVGFGTHKLQESREVFITYETLRKHLFCTGQTGAGKSSVLETQIYSILRSKAQGNATLGFTLIDPKLGACIGVMNAINKLVSEGVIKDKAEFMKKVVYVDLKHDECNFGINILNSEVETTELIDYFTSVFNSTGVQIERYIRHAVNLLMRDNKTHYIGDILKVFEDDSYRDEIINRVIGIYGNDVKTFFSSMIVEEFKMEKIDPLINRISPFIADEKTKKIFNTRDDLEIKKWIEQGYIVMFNFDSFSPPDVQMIGGYVATKYFNYGMKRREGAHSHYLIIDEAHDVQVNVLSKIIAKLRSRGVHLWLYTQFLEQFNDKLLRAVTSNMATKLILQQGTSSSKRASEIVKIDKNRIEEMAKGACYCVTENSSGEIVRTLIKSKPPYRYDCNGDILAYSSQDEKEDIKFKNEIDKRNKELKSELEKHMIFMYPSFKKEKVKKQFKKGLLAKDIK